MSNYNDDNTVGSTLLIATRVEALLPLLFSILTMTSSRLAAEVVVEMKIATA